MTHKCPKKGCCLLDERASRARRNEQRVKQMGTKTVKQLMLFIVHKLYNIQVQYAAMKEELK